MNESSVFMNEIQNAKNAHILCSVKRSDSSSDWIHVDGEFKQQQHETCKMCSVQMR